MKTLLSLPEELHMKVFGHFIEDTHLRQAMVPRQVCKTFRKCIDHIITTQVPLRRFEQLSGLSNFPNWVEKFIKHRMPCGPTRPDGRQELTIFVDRVLEALIRDDYTPGASDTDALRETYKTKLIEVLAFTCWFRYEPLLVDNDVLDCGELAALQSYASGTTFDNYDMLVAAASVGNLAALGRSASKVKNFRGYGKVFCSLWRAVVISDQSESLKLLLPQIPPFPRSVFWVGWSEEKWKDTLIVEEMWHAILTACDYGKVATGKLLIDRFVKEGALWEFTNRAHDRNPIYRCMRSGCVELLDYLLEKICKFDQGKIRVTIKRVFKEAGRHVEVMRYLLDRKLIWPPTPSSQHKCFYRKLPEHPLKVAVTSGRIEMLQLMQDHGVDFSEYHDLFWQAIKSDIAGFKFRTVEYLYENGAIVHGCEFSAMQMLMDAVAEGYSRPTIDGCKTLVYILSKAMVADLIQPPKFTRSEWETFSANFQHVLDCGLELPLTPMDFAEVAKECVAWLADCAAAAPVER